MSGVEIYYNHGGVDYQMPMSSSQGTGWRNLNGNMLEDVTALTEGSTGYMPPSPGNYIITFHNNYGLVERLGSIAWADESTGLIYDYGGEVSGTIVNTMSIYDTVTRTWSAGIAGGGARKLGSASVYDGKAYVYGGIDDSGDYLNSLYSYDMDTGTWTDLGSGGTARADFSMIILEGKIYIAGGYNADGGVAVTDIYDIEAGTWSEGGSLSNPDVPGGADTPTPQLLLDDGTAGDAMIGLQYYSATWVDDETFGGLWLTSDSEYEDHPVHWFKEEGAGWSHEEEHTYTGNGFIGGRGWKSCYYNGAIYTLNEEGATDITYKNELDTNLEDISGVVYPATAPCHPLNRYQTIMDSWKYDVYEGTKTNIYTDVVEDWYRPLVDPNYAVVGSKDGHVYVVDAEDYEVEHPEGGLMEFNRLVLWVWTRFDNTWTKIILGDYTTPWGDYEDLGGTAKYHTGAASDDAIYLVSKAVGVIDGTYDCALIKIQMLSGDAINSYIVEVGGKIMRLRGGETGTLEQYDPATDTWSSAISTSQSLPAGGLTFMYGNSMFMVGGKDEFGNPNGETYIINPHSGIVRKTSAGVSSSPHVAGNSVSMNGAAFIWGGTGSGYQPYMEIYNPESGMVETLDMTYYTSDDFWESMAACDDGTYIRFSDDWDTCRAAVFAAYPDLDVSSPDIEDSGSPNIRGDITVDGSPNNNNYNLITGLNIQIVPCPHYLQKSNVIVGGFYDSSEGRIIMPQRFGYVPVGSNSSTTTFKIKNVTGATLENITVKTLNRCRIKQVGGATPIKAVRQVDSYDPIGFSTLQRLGITFSDYDASNGTISIYVDEKEHDFIDTTDDTVMVAGKKLKVDGSTEYKFGDNSIFSGIGIILATDTDDDSIAEIYINPGGDIWRLRENGDSTWVRGSRGISVDDLSNNGTVSVDVQCSPRRNAPIDLGPLEGLLFVEGDAGSFGIVLSATPVDGPLQHFTVRATVIPQAVYNKMSEFGVTVS